ncbi:MAG: SDR family oxidoreductase [Patescibacteria group bacterium]
MNLKNKIVLITGAGRGIGCALAGVMRRQGARVICFDSGKQNCQFAGVEYFKVDVTNGAQIKLALKKIGGPIQVLVNNAGIMRRGDIFNTSEKDYDAVMDINVKGAWLMLKHCGSHLAPDATVVHLSSRHALTPPADPAIYALSKNADLYLAEILKMTNPKFKVKIACPGPTDTAVANYGVKGKALMEKKKIMKSPEYVAEKIMGLVESDKGYLIYNPKRNDYFLHNHLPFGKLDKILTYFIY